MADKTKSAEMPCRFRIVTNSKGHKHCLVYCKDSPLKCDKCGWNPAVEKQRKQKIFAEKGLTYAD